MHCFMFNSKVTGNLVVRLGPKSHIEGISGIQTWGNFQILSITYYLIVLLSLIYRIIFVIFNNQLLS